jgi:hypothetical protein
MLALNGLPRPAPPRVPGVSQFVTADAQPVFPCACAPTNPKFDPNEASEPLPRGRCGRCAIMEVRRVRADRVRARSACSRRSRDASVVDRPQHVRPAALPKPLASEPALVPNRLVVAPRVPGAVAYSEGVLSVDVVRALRRRGGPARREADRARRMVAAFAPSRWRCSGAGASRFVIYCADLATARSGDGGRMVRSRRGFPAHRLSTTSSACARRPNRHFLRRDHERARRHGLVREPASEPEDRWAIVRLTSAPPRCTSAASGPSPRRAYIPADELTEGSRSVTPLMLASYHFRSGWSALGIGARPRWRT